MFISGRSEILDFGTYPVFSRKNSASTTQSRESVFLIFSFLEIKKISSHFISFPFSFSFIPSFLHNHMFSQIIFFLSFHFPPPQIPPKISSPHLHLTPLHGKLLLAKRHLIPLFYKKPLFFYFNCNSFTNSKTYKYPSFSISIPFSLFFTSPKL